MEDEGSVATAGAAAADDDDDDDDEKVVVAEGRVGGDAKSILLCE